jgi:ribosomal protein L7Ae-like RNA K-turn-binding protein
LDQNQINSILSLVGIAAKAGKVSSGEFSTETAIKKGKACLVIVSEDASDNTKKKFTNSCAYYDVPIVLLADKETLGHAIGKQQRASAAILDTGLGQAILKKYNGGN